MCIRKRICTRTSICALCIRLYLFEKVLILLTQKCFNSNLNEGRRNSEIKAILGAETDGADGRRHRMYLSLTDGFIS